MPTTKKLQHATPRRTSAYIPYQAPTIPGSLKAKNQCLLFLFIVFKIINGLECRQCLMLNSFSTQLQGPISAYSLYQDSHHPRLSESKELRLLFLFIVFRKILVVEVIIALTNLKCNFFLLKSEIYCRLLFRPEPGEDAQ
jgi:hypothetical protein